jgi:hypothetical protein
VVFIAPSAHEVNNALAAVIYRHARTMFLILLKAFKECGANGLPPGRNLVNCEQRHDQPSMMERSFSI